MVPRFLPSARSRLEIRNTLREALAGDGPPRLPVPEAMLRNWNANLGAFAMPPTPHSPGDARAAMLGLLPSPLVAWTGDRTFQGDYLDRFLDLAESHGIPVFLVVPPMHPDYEAREIALGNPPVLDAFLRMTRDRHPRITILDGRRKGYDASLFCEDIVHLNVRSAFGLHPRRLRRHLALESRRREARHHRRLACVSGRPPATRDREFPRIARGDFRQG